MNIIIPMGGIGSRFTKHGYRLPKPLINIAGRPMLTWIISNLRFEPEDTLFLALRPSIDLRFDLSQSLRQQFPEVDIVTVPVEFDTRGAAETLFIVTQHMTDVQLARRTISLDCDTIYFSDILSRVRALPISSGCSLYFHDPGSQPIYSYISFERGEPGKRQGKRITSIAEKVRISPYANTGGYGFSSGFLLQEFLEQTLDRGVPSSGEYYTSAVIDTMLQCGHEFRGVHVEDFSCVGTVPQLQDFLRELRTTRLHQSPRMTFGFDLFGALLPAGFGSESSGVPCSESMRVARSLAHAGHRVLIRVPRLDASARATIENMNIKGAVVVEGLPTADVYISSKAVDAAEDVQRGVGWICDEE